MLPRTRRMSVCSAMSRSARVLIHRHRVVDRVQKTGSLRPRLFVHHHVERAVGDEHVLHAAVERLSDRS